MMFSEYFNIQENAPWYIEYESDNESSYEKRH